MLATLKNVEIFHKKSGRQKCIKLYPLTCSLFIGTIALVYQVRFGHISERKFENISMKFTHLLSFLIKKNRFLNKVKYK